MKFVGREKKSPLIERLYEAFSSYKASAQTMGACGYCVSKNDVFALFSDPLIRLPAEKLEHYSWKAMTTWGTERDWKHFLPRLCELTLENELHFDWIGNKFFLVEWRKWPGEETEIVRDFWCELTVFTAKTNLWFQVNLWIEDLAKLGESGDEGLEIWLKNAAPDEIIDLDGWANNWNNATSALAIWAKRPETIDKLLERL